MRVSIWAMLAVAAALMAAPAQAQTYDPRFPVCLQAYDDTGAYIECTYNSIPQCKASAAGRAAECMPNPFFAANRPGPAARPNPPLR